MKRYFYKIGGVLLIGIVLLTNACKDELYTINDSFYDGMQIMLTNPLKKGELLDTLEVEISNIDQIAIKEVSDSTVVFFPQSFIYRLENPDIAEIRAGVIDPVSRGSTRLDIIFRANHALNTSVILKVFKEYQAVEQILISGTLLQIEVGRTYDFSDIPIVMPMNADNKKLHFFMDASSEQYASITDDGIITAIKNSGRNRAVIHVVSDENPEITNRFRVQIVDEILVSEILVKPGLDDVKVALGTVIDLKACTSVLPATVNEENKKLTFEVVEGAGTVLELNEAGEVKAVGYGTAKIKATSKNGKVSVEFSIHVIEGLTDILRLLWEVETSVDYGYIQEGATGKPEDMFDDKNDTFFIVAKPGKTYDGKKTPEGHFPYFIVDMKSEQKFNYIRWNHRSDKTDDFLRVWGIDIAGSNDGETFTNIQTGIAIDPKFTGRQQIALEREHEYRYVKVTLSNYSDLVTGSTSGSTMQVAEFGLGYK